MEWLYLIEQPYGLWTPGMEGRYWVETWKDSAGDTRWRDDGYGMGEPHWADGTGVLIGHLMTDRIIADSQVVGEPRFNARYERWDFTLKVTAVRGNGPSLSGSGIDVVQGSRQQIDHIDYVRIARALRKNSEPYDFGTGN